MLNALNNYCKGEKHEVRKQSFLVLFYSAKSNSDHVTILNFSSSFFEKLIFLLFRPLYCKSEKNEVRKKQPLSAL